jgi:CubicO group peptidase (beta-lactamase class C family)
MQHALTLIFAFLTALSLPAQQPAFISDSLDTYIQRGMKDWAIPALAITVVKDGKVLISKGYGTRMLDKKEPVDENTLFIIASNSKLFTGTALALLEDRKKLSLNDRVVQHIPWFRLYDSVSTQLVTIRDLLAHRVGTRTFQGDFTFWDSNLPQDSIIFKMRTLKPVGLFRQDYGYCNACYVTAGAIAGLAAGTTWEKFVEENVLKPLGMNNTFMTTAGIARRPNVAHPYNNAYGPLDVLPFDQVDNMGPATSMVSCVKDLSKWLLMQLDSGRYEGRRILPWSVLQKTRDGQILTGTRKSGLFPVHFRAYGLGLNLADYNGRQVYWHTGGAFGQVTNVCFVPEEKLGIAILTNNDNQNFFEALRYQLLDAYLGVPYTDRSQVFLAPTRQGEEAARADMARLQARVDKENRPDLPLDQFAGDYRHPVYGRISVSKNRDQLVIRFAHHPNLLGYLDYMDNQEFRLRYSHPGYGIFPAKYTVENGKVKTLEIKVNDFLEYDPYVFEKEK